MQLLSIAARSPRVISLLDTSREKALPAGLGTASTSDVEKYNQVTNQKRQFEFINST